MSFNSNLGPVVFLVLPENNGPNGPNILNFHQKRARFNLINIIHVYYIGRFRILSNLT